MKCSKAQELFSSYLENTIQPPMGVALEQHLAECDRCKAEYGRFHATTVVLDELPEVEPPADLHAMIMARVEEARRNAPTRIKWWSIDWQSAFTLRVPAKAIAGVAAAALVFVGLAQFSPLHTVTANFIGGQRAVSHPIDESTTSPIPLPTGFKADSGARYVPVGSGLSVGVRVDSKSASSTVYMMRLATSSQSAVPVQVSMLMSSAVGSDEAGSLEPLYRGSVSKDREAAVPVVVTRGDGEHVADVAIVRWENAGQPVEEYVFLPSAFGTVAETTPSVIGEGTFDLLDHISADFGTVIMAPGTLTDKSGRVSVSAGSARQAIAEASRQMDLSWQSVGTSVYLVK